MVAWTKLMAASLLTAPWSIALAKEKPKPNSWDSAEAAMYLRGEQAEENKAKWNPVSADLPEQFHRQGYGVPAAKESTRSKPKAKAKPSANATAPVPGSGADVANKTRTAQLQHALDLFTRPLNQTEYYERNWMWIRCRTAFSNRFDVGGSWPGHRGEDWMWELKQVSGWPKPVVNWDFSYNNGLDWGDATVSFDWFDAIEHNQVEAVWAARHAAERHSERYRRELYIWGCPGHEDSPNWRIELEPDKTESEDESPLASAAPTISSIDTSMYDDPPPEDEPPPGKHG